jgi:hypothetical protein
VGIVPARWVVLRRESWGLEFVHTVCRNGRTVGFVVHTVHRDGRQVGFVSIEFKSIVIRALEAIERRGCCVSGGQPRVEDRNIKAGGQVLGDDLNECGGHCVTSHGARRDTEREEVNFD